MNIYMIEKVKASFNMLLFFPLLNEKKKKKKKINRRIQIYQRFEKLTGIYQILSSRKKQMKILQYEPAFRNGLKHRSLKT